jgi:hypothetical protein
MKMMNKPEATMNDVIAELIRLCEVRGELSLEANVKNEQRIAELNQEYLRLQALEEQHD